MTKITGTNTYIDVELDGRTARIAGEMIVGGFVCYKSSTESNRKNGRFAYGNNFWITLPLSPYRRSSLTTSMGVYGHHW